MQHLEGSGTPVLYIGRKVLKGYLLRRGKRCNSSRCCQYRRSQYLFHRLHNNKKTIKDNSLLIYDTPATCFDLKWPSSGRWLKKETSLKVVYKGNIPEISFTMETFLKMVYKANLYNDAL